MREGREEKGRREKKRRRKDQLRRLKREQREGVEVRRKGEGERVVCGSLGLSSTEWGPFFSLTPSIGCLLHPRVKVAYDPRVL